VEASPSTLARAAVAPRPARHRRLQRILAIALGSGLLVWLLVQTGPAAVWAHLRGLGWWAPAILVPYAVVGWADARGWRCTLARTDRAKIPLVSLYAIRLAGEAVNSVTPAAAVGGEPVKAWLLRGHGIPGPEALASVIIAKTALVASQSVFTALGVAAVLGWAGYPALAAIWLVILVTAASVFTAVLVWVQGRSPARAVWRGLGRLFPRAAFVARLEHSARDIDHRLAEFYRIERGAFLRAAAWHMLGWLLGVVEVALIASLIGHPIPWLEALVIEALAQPIRATAIVVPGGLGTQEVGGVWLCTFLGMPAAAATTLWLLKRAREAVFDGIGLLYLARASAPRAPRLP